MDEIQIAQSTPRPGFIDLGLGDPDLSLLPLELIRESAQAFFAAGEKRSLQYGLERGDGNFRRALADFLPSGYGFSVDAESLFVTAGASSALDLICTLFTSPSDTILVEEPSYHLALRIFSDHGLRVISVPGDIDGSFLENLEKSFIEFQPKLLYLIPTFQNPSGRTLPPEDREKLAALAREYEVFILADEVYHFLSYSQTPPAPLASYVEHFPQVVSIGSISKILAPGLRLGWIQAHPSVIERLAGSGLLDSGGGLSPFTSALVRDLIESGGLGENITRLRREYALRLEAMASALKKYLPSSVWMRPRGGFFFWVRLPGVDAAELRQQAGKFNIGLRQGALFSSRQGLKDCFRLAFSYYPVREIEEGVGRLRDCLVSQFNLGSGSS